MINVLRAITMALALGSLAQAADADKTAAPTAPIVISPSSFPSSGDFSAGKFSEISETGLAIYMHTKDKDTKLQLPLWEGPFMKIDMLPDHPEPALKALIRVGKGSHCLIAYNDLCIIAGEHLEAH